MIEGGGSKQALCFNHPLSHIWHSYKIDEVEKAKSICCKCPVRIPCLYNALYKEEQFVGVNGGYSEYDYLTETWVESTNEQETNWPRTDSVIQQLFARMR